MSNYINLAADLERGVFDPLPLDSGPKKGEGRWMVQSIVTPERTDKFDLVQLTWQRMYRELSYKLSDLMQGRDEYIVTRIQSRARVYPEIVETIQLLLVLEIYGVSKERHVVMPAIPDFSYNIAGQPLEWRCGYCRTPNDPHDKTCAKCGAPRALLLHELRSQE